MTSTTKARQKSTRSRTPISDAANQTVTAADPLTTSALKPRQWFLIFLGLLLAVAAIYHPAWHGAILWDDDAHITAPELRSVAGLWRIWFEIGATQQYYPVVHSAFWLMARLWGDSTLGYHLVNILLHATSALLAMIIVERLRIPGALLVGVLFAVHPVHAESVAWITELKNTLSGVFFLSAALAYLRFDTTRSPLVYAAALALFILGLLSKSVTATLPAALLVVFWWRRGALSWRRDVVPLLPFFVVGAGAGLLTAWVERSSIGAVGADFNLTLIERFLVAGRAVCFYLWKLLWPSNLIFFYPRWDPSADAWWQYLYPLGVAASLVALWTVRRWSRAPLAALLFFGVMLGPALGFVNVFPFKYSFVADHFQYLASLGILTFVAASSTWLVEQRLSPAKANALLISTLGLPLALLTLHQSRQYVDAATLYRVTIDRNPRAWLAHNNLAMISLQGSPSPADFARALTGFETALAIDPDEALVHFNVGTTLSKLGRHEEALVHQREAVRLAPGYADAWGNLAADLQKLGRYQEAVQAYRVALGINPEMHGLRLNLGVALQELGRSAEASVELREGLTSGPGKAQDHAALARTWLSQGRVPEAIAAYQEALRIAPGSPQVLNDLGFALLQAGRVAEAETHLREAVRLLPNSAEAHDNLGNVLQQTGRLRESLVEYAAALAAAGGTSSAEIHNDMGVALAKLGRREESIAHFRQALRLKPGFRPAEMNLERALRAGGS